MPSIDNHHETVRIFDDVTCIYHHEIWHVYKVNCYILPITNINPLNKTIFTQLNLFLKLALFAGHPVTVGGSVHRVGDD